MKNSVIYYPYTHVPYKSTWFNQIVLYWDDVYSIDAPRNRFQPYMKELIGYELVKPIKVTADVDISINDDKFLDYIDNPGYPVQHDAELVNWDNAVKLFHEKFDQNKSLAKGLIDRGLAKKYNLDYKVEPYTAKLYMLFLAGVIGGNNDYNATPITNTQVNLSYCDPSSYNQGKQRINKEHYSILDDIFPGPCGPDVDIRDIYKFKNNNQEELTSFRSYAENQIRKIERTENPEKKRDRAARFKIESELIKKDISEKMEVNGWKHVIGNNLWMFGLHGVGVAASIATGIGESILIHALGFTGESVKVVYDKFKRDKKLREHPLAYAVMVNKKFKVRDCNSHEESVIWEI